MNPLQSTLTATIAKEAAMTDTTANDRREGYADGLSGKYQPRRSAAYVAACWDAWKDADRLSLHRAAARLGFWQRVICWLRACLS